jgi:hypothetical protein
MLLKFVKDIGHSLQDFLVKQPFLEAETFGATSEILSFLEEEFVEDDAAGAGAVFIECGGTILPLMPPGEAAQAMNTRPERGGGFGKVARCG